MRRCILTAAVILPLLIQASARAEVQWLPATVTLSDGTVLKGEVNVPNDSLMVHNEAQGRRYTVRLAEMKLLECTIEKQSMEQKWIFRESGLDDKIYTGETYPVRHLIARVTFHDGQQLSGHMISKTLYVKADGRTQRFILRRKQEGKVGETLNDLVYVRRIDLSGEGAGARGSIQGTVEIPWEEKLRTIMAINRDKLFCVEAKGDPHTGKFRVGDCTEGRYDLVVVTDKSVYVYFSREADEGAARFNASQVAEMQAWVDKLRAFFHVQRILYAAGNDKRAFALIFQERRGGTTLQGAELLHRYEVWAMHKPKDEWQIEKRFFLWRDVSQDLSLKERAVYVSPALGGHRVTAEVSSVDVSAKLSPNKQQPIPPAPEPGDTPDGD